MCVHVHTFVVQHLCRAKMITYRRPFSICTMWVMEVEIRSTSLMAGILTN